MRLLLDENFPLALERRLRDKGYTAEHLITLGLRATLDSELSLRLQREADLVLLTQDAEFLELPIRLAGKVVVSRVSQARPIEERLAIWLTALEPFLRDLPPQSLFELTNGGDVVAWDVVDA